MKVETRVERLKAKYESKFGTKADDIFISPGRIELLGNHTDHNNGKVLVSSVSLNIMAAVGRRSDNKIVFYSKGFSRIEVDLSKLALRKSDFGKSKGIIKGVLNRFKELNLSVGGFNVCCNSSVPNGAGVSSSAAFEVLVAKILSEYYNGDKLYPFELAKIAQYAETIYFNKPCGLLDQSGIALGGVNYIDFKNTDKPLINTIHVDMNSYQFIIINTGDSHEKLTPQYASIKDDMRAVSLYFGKHVLREVNENDFFKNKDNIINNLGERAFLRAKHYFEENNRVDKAFQALVAKKPKQFLKLLKESGESSYNQLKNCYVESEDEALPKALNWVKSNFPDSYYRVHGGGFAGTMLMVVKKRGISSIMKKLNEHFGSKNVLKVSLTDEGTTKL